MNEVSIIDGVECYEKDGVVYLKLENVARGLGFTQEKNGVEYVKWERVEAYLRDLGFSPLVGKDTFIPENVFYRLAMKAKNDTAERFQAKVADEIIPSIRKTGMYSGVDLSKVSLETQMLMQTAQRLFAQEIQLVEQSEKLNNITTEIKGMKQAFAERSSDWKADMNRFIRIIAYCRGIPYQQEYKELYSEFESTNYCNLKIRQENKRKKMMEEGRTKADIEESTRYLTIISENKVLKPAFETLVRRHLITDCDPSVYATILTNKGE